MGNTRILKTFAVSATVNDVILYLIGLAVTGQFNWFYFLFDISTPEARTTMLLTIIGKNSAVLLFMVLKDIYKVFDVKSASPTE